MPTPWKTIACQTVIEDRWISLKRYRCTANDGRVIDPYYLLEYPDWVNIVGVTSDWHAILVREYRHGAGCIIEQIPSGIVEPGDVNPMAAAARELAEETGYVANRLVPLGHAYANPANQTNRVFFFLGLDLKEAMAQNLDSNEDIEVFQENLVDFAESVLEGHITVQGLHLLALQLTIQYIVRSPLEYFATIRGNLGRRIFGIEL